MKKGILLTICLTVILMLGGCGNSNISILNKNIIERRDNYFTVSTDDYQASFYSGMREDPYALDGNAEGLVEYGILVFAAHEDGKLTEEEYSYTLKINEEQLSGTLEKNDTDNNYYVDIERKVNDLDTLIVSVQIKNQTYEQELINISNNFAITQENAIKICSGELSEILNSMSNKKDSGEVIIKILKDKTLLNEARYYWYIAIITTKGKMAGILIDTNSGEIISKKV